ncbi:MAG: SAM hydrolase/SAM-dependent halogenase family protein [Steroidobacteraceae bacterium]
MARQSSGIITLLTDFGLADPFVGVMKGAILSRFPEARIVDLTHELPVHRPTEAGFWLARSFEYFPSGTVHVAVVDPGVGTSRGILCMASRGHLLVAPDNGLLAQCGARDPHAETVQLASAGLAGIGIRQVSATFHGRDIFAPVAAELAAGRVEPEALGVCVSERRGAMTPTSGPRAARSGAAEGPSEPVVAAGMVSGVVVTIDHFGNLITNIDAALLQTLEEPRVFVGEQRLRLDRTYGDVAAGELLALINSFGVLEIAQGEGSAALALGVGRGARVTIRGSAKDLLGGANPL